MIKTHKICIMHRRKQYEKNRNGGETFKSKRFTCICRSFLIGIINSSTFILQIANSIKRERVRQYMLQQKISVIRRRYKFSHICENIDYTRIDKCVSFHLRFIEVNDNNMFSYNFISSFLFFIPFFFFFFVASLVFAMADVCQSDFYYHLEQMVTVITM